MIAHHKPYEVERVQKKWKAYTEITYVSRTFIPLENAFVIAFTYSM